MNVTEQDKQNSFKEIRIAMLDGKFEIVRVSALKPEKLIELMGQKMSHAVIFEFVGETIGRDANFILRIDPQSFYEIFVTASALVGLQNEVRQAMLNVSEKLRQQANEQE